MRFEDKRANRDSGVDIIFIQTKVTLGVVESVNVGAARTVEWRGDRVTTAIWKVPASDQKDYARESQRRRLWSK